MLGVLKAPPLPTGDNLIFRMPPKKPDSDETAGRVRCLTTVEGMMMSETRRMRQEQDDGKSADSLLSRE